MVITRDSAIKSLDPRKLDGIPFDQYHIGMIDGETCEPFGPYGNMWDQYDYGRGYEVGELMHEEANLGLLGGGDE